MKSKPLILLYTILLTTLLIPIATSATSPVRGPFYVLGAIFRSILMFPPLLTVPILGALFHRKQVAIFQIIFGGIVLLIALFHAFFTTDPYYSFDDSPYPYILIIILFFGILAVIASLISAKIKRIANIRSAFQTLQPPLQFLIFLGGYALITMSFLLLFLLIKYLKANDIISILLAATFWAVLFITALYELWHAVKNGKKECIYKKTDHLYSLVLVVFFIMSMGYFIYTLL